MTFSDTEIEMDMPDHLQNLDDVNLSDVLGNEPDPIVLYDANIDFETNTLPGKILF